MQLLASADGGCRDVCNDRLVVSYADDAQSTRSNDHAKKDAVEWSMVWAMLHFTCCRNDDFQHVCRRCVLFPADDFQWWCAACGTPYFAQVLRKIVQAENQRTLLCWSDLEQPMVH